MKNNQYVINPNPVFTPPIHSKPRPAFIQMAMQRATEIDVACSESVYIYSARNNNRVRSLNKHRANAMRAMIQAMLFHFNIVSDMVHASVEQLSDECGLSTISAAGNKSITRASRLITEFLEPLGFIRAQKKWNKNSGNYYPKSIVLTDKFFGLLDITAAQVRFAKIQQLNRINKRMFSKRKLIVS